MDVSHILNDLNDAQREAVTSENPSLLVLAGAGSGKTRALVYRIAWLMQVRNVPASSIMAVTFTNKAAREMRERIADMLQFSPRGMWVGTFHGIAHRLLKAHWQEAGLDENFLIIDSDDQLRIIKRLLKELELDESRWSPKTIQWTINGYKDEGRRACHIEHFNDPHEKTLVRIYEYYEKYCERTSQVDFGELLLRAHELWLKQPHLLDHYQQRFQHLLVDEFQDTNTIQYAWIRVLAGKRSHITVVGDDDQSIYGWRGAKIENIQQFAIDFENTQTIKLEQNYRSSSTILDAANAVIANNPGRLGKDLWTDDAAGELISLYAAYNEHDEAHFIVEQLEKQTEEGVNLSDQAVLYRSNAQSRVLEEELLKKGIAYRIYGGQRFYDRLEIKNIIAYLRLIQTRDDDAAFERVVNTPTRGIGNKTVETLRFHAREKSMSLWQAAVYLVENQKLAARASTSIQHFLNLINDLANLAFEMSLGELAEATLDATDLIEFHGKERGEKGRARVENLQEFIVAASQFESEDEEVEELRAFLDTVALDAGEQQADEQMDAVQLMTLHSAKGLEFPVVYLAGLEENLFPHKMSIDDPGGIEEERRLCYVGITRAMQKLYISYAEARQFYGQDSFNPISRFVKEIPADCLQEVRVNSTISRPLSVQRGNQNTSHDSGFQLGQRVFHEIFGEGVVLDLEGQSSHARVQVNFDLEGSKWLVLAYAKLEAI